MNLLHKALTPDFWQNIRENDIYETFRQRYLDRWDEECENTPPCSLKYSDWTEFFKSGKRIERNYFGARQQLMAATFLSLIYPEEEKYFIRVEDQLFSICNEYTWCVPAHFGPILEGDRAKLDLFASETALTLALVYGLLEDRLDEFIKKRVIEELDWRVVESMRKTKQFSFETMSNNWSAVCTCGIGCTMMLLFPDAFSEFKPRFDKAIEVFLSGYRNDGVCLEGASYWAYGFGFFCFYADMLNRFTEGKENYFEIEKVKNIATFMQKTFLTGNTCVSFSDGGRSGSFNVGHLHFLKSVYPDDVILYKTEYKNTRDGCARLLPALYSVLWCNEAYYNNPEDSTASFTFYAEESEWLIKRTPSFGFAAKAGYNGEPHNHNDLGSFIYAKNGDQIFFDLGPGAYTKQYFSGRRYETFQACSRSHSVPIVAGSYQVNGNDRRCKNVSFGSDRFTADISGGYNVEGLEALVRCFEIKTDGVTLTDTVDYTGDGIITERFVTLHEPKINADSIEVGDGVLYFDSTGAKPYILEEELNNGSICYLINFDLPKGTKTFTVKIK